MAEMTVGKAIRMPCMRRGLVKYPDETVLVSQASLEQMAQSAHGIPVTIEHPHIPIDSESLKEIQVVGRVAKFDYDMPNDLWMAEFIVDDDEAVKLLQSGWGVSTAWYGNEYTGGGTYNNVPYERELVQGKYEHLAIVKNPRYEMAIDPVFLNSKDSMPCKSSNDKCNIVINSKPNAIGGKSMFAKIWRTTREEVKANENEELVLELEHGQVPLSQIVDELKEHRAKAQEAEAEMAPESEKRILNDDDEVEVDGQKMKVSALRSEYMNMKNAMKKAEDESEGSRHLNPDENEAMCDENETGKLEASSKNEAVEEKEEKEEKKENDKREDDAVARFNSLKSAYENGIGIEIESEFLSTRERVEMGRARYGSTK